MTCIYTWWNLNKKVIPKHKFKQIKTVSSWWNPSKYHEYLQDFIAMGQLSNPINSAENLFKEERIESDKHIFVNADIRLDNRESLIKKLSVRDPKISDSSILLKAYKHFGEKCVNHLIGAFAFSIWDAHEGKLFCARDQIGIKPFNYFFDSKHFLVASQKKSILASGIAPTDVDYKFIVKSLNGNMAVNDNTENRHIKKLMPAHCLVLNQSGIQIRRYWELDIHQETKYKNDQEYVDHFLELFHLSINDRIQGSHHIGSHLSGGLDSSGITALSAQFCRTQQKKFYSLSYTFPEDKRDKLKANIFDYNDLVNEQVVLAKIEHSIKVTKASPRSFRNKIEHEALVCDGISWSNNVNTEYEIQEASQQKKVGILLSGFLGDELVTSFCRPYYLEHLDKGAYIKFFLSKHKNKYKPNYLAFLFVLHLCKKLGITINEEKMAKKYQKYRSSKNKENSPYLFASDYIAEHPALKDALSEQYEQEIHQKIPMSLKEYQSNHISRAWTSRRIESEKLSSLPFNIDYRYPMADIRLLQYTLSVPMEQKRNSEFARWLFRRAMKDYVPDSIRLGVKYNSVLKPLAYFTDYSKDHSHHAFWKDLMQSNATGFLDQRKIKEALLANKKLPKIYKYAILGLLVKQKKIKF